MAGVIHIHVPFYENLKLNDIFSFFMRHETVVRYMPDDKELRKLPRQWICNVGAAVIGQPFQDWVAERIKERNMAVTQDKGLLISMDP